MAIVLVLAAQEAAAWVVLVDFEAAAVALVLAVAADDLAAVVLADVVLVDVVPHEFDQQHRASPIFAEFPATRNDGKSTPSNVG